jgi:AcrR family transcriptional regulator
MVDLGSERKLSDLADKPEQILQGAMQVFLQYGYAETSMDRVAAQAGVSKHTIYNYFEGKEALFVALFERLTLSHFQMEFGCELPASDPPAQVLRRLAEIFLARMDDPEYIAFVRLLFAESGRFPELAQLYLKEICHKGDECIGAYLKEHPDLNLPDPETTARIFTGALVSFILSQGVLHGHQLQAFSKEAFVTDLIGMALSDRVVF